MVQSCYLQMIVKEWILGEIVINFGYGDMSIKREFIM